MAFTINLKLPKKQAKKTPAQALPFKTFDKYLKMDDGTFRCVMKVSPINNELLESDENDEIVERMREAINGAGLTTNQITVSSERVNLDEYKEFLEKKSRDISDSYFLERLDAIKEYVADKSGKDQITKSFYFTVSSKHTNEQRAQEDFEEAFRKIESSLLDAEMMVRILRRSAGLSMLYEKLNPKTSLQQPYHDGMNNITAIAPGAIQHIGEDYSILDGMYYRFFTITNYPTKNVSVSWMRNLFNVNAEVDTAIIMQPTGKNKVIEDIDKSLGHIRYRMDQPDTKASEKRELQAREDSSDVLIDELSSEAENMYNVSVIISVRDKSLKELDIACERVTTAVSSSRMNMRQLILLGNDPFWMTLPIAYKSRFLSNPNMYWPMHSSAIASILPFDSSDFNMKKGVIKGKNPKNNSLIIADRRDRKLVDNPNEVVIAPSGRGKTWYTQADISRENSLGTKITIIDPEREYKFEFGQRVVFSLGSKFITNPFHIRSAILDSDDDEGSSSEFNHSQNYVENVGQYLQRKIADLIPWFREIYKTMDSTEEADITEAIRIMYEQTPGVNLTFNSTELPDIFPTLTDFDKVLQTSEFADSLLRFRKNMKPYIDGIYARMFNGQTNWSMDEELTVLDIHSLSENIQPQMMYLLLQDIWEYIKIDRNALKGFYVDEAWKLASPDNPQTLKFLFQMAKRIRKYGGYLTTITQNVQDFFGATFGGFNYGQAIFDNAYFKLFLGLSEKDYTSLINISYSFSKKEERILKRKKSKGRGIYVIGSTRVEIQCTPLVDELQFIDREEYKKIKHYAKGIEFGETSSSIA